MQTRRGFLNGLAGALITTPAVAQSDRVIQSVMQQLERQGFHVNQVSRTLLGRVRVLAERGGVMRELVIDPRNGVILRDYITGRDSDDLPRISDPGGGGYDPDDDDEEEEDDDDVEDEGDDDEDEDDDDDDDDDEDDEEDDGADDEDGDEEDD